MAGKVKSLVFSDGVATTAPTLSAGSGEINLISNPSDADSGWAASGAGVTVATTTTAGELPLGGVIDTAIKVTGVSGTDYARYRWTVPASLKNHKLKAEWYQRTVGAYASGDFKVEVYKNSASDYSGSYTEFALSTDASGTSALPAATGKYTTTFDTDSGDYYEIRIVRVAGTAALSLAQITVGPGIQPQGAVVGEWQSYTPAVTGYGTGGAASGYPKGWWRRVGDSVSLHLAVKKDTSGGTGTATVSFGFPTGLTADSAKLSATGAPYPVVGTAGSDIAYEPSWQARLTSTTAFFLTNGTDGIFEGGDWAANETVWINASAPIAEWSGSGTVNLAQNDVEYASNSSTSDADDTASFVYGSAGSSIVGALTSNRQKRVRFQTPIQPTDALVLEVSRIDLGNAWFPLAMIAEANYDMTAYEEQNGVEYGAGIGDQVSNTDVDIRFARYARSTGATFGAAGQAWTGVSASTRWRVRKVSGGAAVGFGLADTAGNSGLVNPYLAGSGVVYAGSYTPTLVGVLNVAAATVPGASFQYMRIGQFVSVWGNLTIDPTAGSPTATALTITLPAAPTNNFSNTFDLVGTGVGDSAATAGLQGGQIYASTGAKTATYDFNANDASNRGHRVTFSYKLV